VQSLQIATGDVKDGNPLYYDVEYRNPSKATFNAQDNGKVRELGPGVHIDVAPGYTASGGDHRVLLLDTSAAGDFGDPRLTPGRSFSDPDGRVTISVVDAGPDSAHVKVTFPKGGSGSNTCSNGAIPPTGGGTPSGVAALYQDCPFGGWTVSLMPGDYTAAQLATLGAKDNDASSVWLANGFEATLFDGPDLTGNSVKLTGSSQCLVSQNFNDVMSSIRIVAIGTGSAGAGGSGAAGSGTATGGKGGVGGASAGKGGASGSGTSAGGASAGAGGAPKGTGGVGGSAMKGGSGGTSTATTGGSGGHVTGGAAGHATAGAGGGTLQGAAGNDAANGDDSSSSGSGCSTSGTSGGGSAGWLMLGVAALIARGRRTRNRALSPSRREQGTGNRLQAMLGSGLRISALGGTGEFLPRRDDPLFRYHRREFGLRRAHEIAHPHRQFPPRRERPGQPRRALDDVGTMDRGPADPAVRIAEFVDAFELPLGVVRARRAVLR
jgi:MYXO-CTERM domain-containing protein